MIIAPGAPPVQDGGRDTTHPGGTHANTAHPPPAFPEGQRAREIKGVPLDTRQGVSKSRCSLAGKLRMLACTRDQLSAFADQLAAQILADDKLYPVVEEDLCRAIQEVWQETTRKLEEREQVGEHRNPWVEPFSVRIRPDLTVEPHFRVTRDERSGVFIDYTFEPE